MSGNTGSAVKSGTGTFAVAVLDTADERLDAIDELLDTIDALLDATDELPDIIDPLLDAIDELLETITGLLDAIDDLLDATDELLDMINELLLREDSLEAGALDATPAAEEGAGLAFPSPPPPPQAIIKADVLITAVRSKPRITTSGRYFIAALIE